MIHSYNLVSGTQSATHWLAVQSLLPASDQMCNLRRLLMALGVTPIPIVEHVAGNHSFRVPRNEHFNVGPFLTEECFGGYTIEWLSKRKQEMKN